MNILITGAKGFVGKNLVENLKTIRDGKNHTHPRLHISNIYEYDTNSSPDDLCEYCRSCDFVFNLAGVNRPKTPGEFEVGNVDFVSHVLSNLKKWKNRAPVMLSSSIQASLTGRFKNSEYGRSKLAGEKLVFDYAASLGTKVLVYRFPNLAGKWCKPNYNSAIATFCSAVANSQPYTVNDRSAVLELLFIDDLLEEMLNTLEGREHRCNYPKAGEIVDGLEYDGLTAKACKDGKYCYVPATHRASLGEIVDLLKSFKELNESALIPEMPQGSLAYKLYSMYLSYLPEKEMSYPLHMHEDNRGVFAELFKTKNNGQVSINITRAGQMKGQHWHNTKWEIFVVVSGHGLIQERKIGIDPTTGKEYPVHRFEVFGKQMKAVLMLPGYAHNLINLDTEKDLVTVMWSNGPFDAEHPDTFFEPVTPLAAIKI